MRPCFKGFKKFGAMEKSFLRIVAALTVAALLLFFCGCEKSTTEEPEEAAPPFWVDDTVSLVESVSLESDVASFTVDALNVNGYSEPELHLSVINHTDRDLIFEANELYVNGYKVMGSMSKELAAFEAGESTLTIPFSELEDSRIHSVETIEMSLAAKDVSSDDEVWTSDFITLRCSGDPALNEDPAAGGKVLYDRDGLKILSPTSPFSSDTFGKAWLFYVENNTDREVLIQCSEASVNGVSVFPTFSCALPAGRRAVEPMMFLSSSLESKGVQSFDTFECSFVFYDINSYSVLGQTERFSLTK